MNKEDESAKSNEKLEASNGESKPTNKRSEKIMIFSQKEKNNV